jgi:hypothetical protein
MKKLTLIFVSLWATASIMLFVLVDYNAYLLRDKGTLILKDHASTSERIIFSSLIAILYSAVNTGIAFILFRNYSTEPNSDVES